MKPKISKWLYWTPRVLTIAFLCFLTLFSFDVIQLGLSVGQIALGLLMHNIPVIVLAIVLRISWKYEIVGGIVFILAAIAYIVSIAARGPFERYMVSCSLIIAGPAVLIGALFLLNWYRKK